MSLCCFEWSFSNCSEQGPLFRYRGSSLWWPLLLWIIASGCTGSISCRTLPEWLWHMALVAPRHVGSKAMYSALEGEFLATVSPWKSRFVDFLTVSHGSLVCISLIAVVSIFTCPLAIHTSSLEKFLFRLCAHFLIGLLLLLLFLIQS